MAGFSPLRPRFNAPDHTEVPMIPTTAPWPGTSSRVDGRIRQSTDDP